MSEMEPVLKIIKDKEMLTDDVKVYMNEIDLVRVVRKLSECFGSNQSIGAIHATLTDLNLPKKVFNNIEHVAGYKGPNRVPDGNHEAVLVDIKTTKTDNIYKLVFSVSHMSQARYIYQVVDLRPKDLLDHAKSIGNRYTVHVVTEMIKKINQPHSVVDGSYEHE